jgi:glutathione S-transferase
MIHLHQPPPTWGAPSISPFCIKVESYLRMVGLPYAVKLGDLRQAPKGKVPYIEDEGVLLGDSQLILEHLKRKHGDPLDAKLSAREVALGHVVRRMLEESVYWHIAWLRWAGEDGFKVMLSTFEALLPPGVAARVMPSFRENVLQALQAQGLGRHKPEEIVEMGKADIAALAALLGDQPFLLGSSPTSFDATVYGFVVAITSFPVDSELRAFTLKQHNLVRYCERFHQRFFATSSR